MKSASSKASASSPALAALGPLVTTRELAQLFRVDARTIKRWIKRNHLPSPVKIGGSNRWRLEDIRKTLESV